MTFVLAFDRKNAGALVISTKPKGATGSPLALTVQQFALAQEDYYALLENDQAALDDVNDWIRENEAFRKQGGG